MPDVTPARYAVWVVLLLCVAPALCDGADAGPATTSGSAIVEHVVLPSDTDNRIDTFTGHTGTGVYQHHAVYNPTAPSRNVLVVFLPGTFGHGEGSPALNAVIANEGFHLVSLAYPNTVSISHLKRSADPDWAAKARANIVWGRAPYANLTVNEANSIEHRLLALLRYPAVHFPSEHWDRHLTRHQSIDWGSLILAGQSQGEGHAAFMAKTHRVARVLMFGAPKDWSAHFKAPAKWLSDPSATPLNRFFSFVHHDDEHHGCTYPQQLGIYRALKLSPAYPVIDVDRASPPYSHTRLLTSTAPQTAPHGSVIHDVGRCREAWRYLLTEPVS